MIKTFGKIIDKYDENENTNSICHIMSSLDPFLGLYLGLYIIILSLKSISVVPKDLNVKLI